MTATTALYARPCTAQQRGALAWLLAVLAVLACAVALAAGPASWSAADAQAEAVLEELAEPPVCTASVTPDVDKDTADRDWAWLPPQAAPVPLRTAQPSTRTAAWPQLHLPPPQRPPRARLA